MNSTARYGNVIMTFSDKRRITTLHRALTRWCSIMKNSAPRPIDSPIDNRRQIGMEESVGIQHPSEDRQHQSCHPATISIRVPNLPGSVNLNVALFSVIFVHAISRSTDILRDILNRRLLASLQTPGCRQQSPSDPLPGSGICTAAYCECRW